MSELHEPQRPGRPTGPAVLASDDEREAVIARLQHAVGEGRLTADEAGSRIGAVYRTRYRSELASPVADLPETGRDARSPLSWDELWTQTLWRGRMLFDGSQITSPGPRARRQAALAGLAILAVLWVMVWMMVGVLAH